MNASKSETSIFGPVSAQGLSLSRSPLPCVHKEAIDLSLEIYNLQSFILELALPDDDIAKSAVTVEGDRADRDLGSLCSL